MELTKKVNELSSVLYDVKYHFTLEKLEEAIVLVEEIYKYTGYNCGNNLETILNVIKSAGDVDKYDKERITEYFDEIQTFSALYNNLENNYNDKAKCNFVAMKILCKKFYDNIEDSDNLEEFNKAYNNFIEELDNLKDDVENALEEE